MYQAIAGADDGTPRDIWIPALRFWLNFVGCFADNLDQTNNGQREQIVAIQICALAAFGELYCFLRRIQHMLETDNVTLGHKLSSIL